MEAKQESSRRCSCSNSSNIRKLLSHCNSFYNIQIIIQQALFSQTRWVEVEGLQGVQGDWNDIRFKSISSIGVERMTKVIPSIEKYCFLGFLPKLLRVLTLLGSIKLSTNLDFTVVFLTLMGISAMENIHFYFAFIILIFTWLQYLKVYNVYKLGFMYLNSK